MASPSHKDEASESRPPSQVSSNTRSSTIRFTGDSHDASEIAQSPTSTMNDLPICESPMDIKHEPFPFGIGALSGAQPILNDGYTAEPAKLYRKPIESTFPSRAPRYTQNIKIENNTGPWILNPCQSMHIHSDRPIPDWRFHTHPEGQPYFQNISKDRRFRFLTEADLFVDSVLDEINLFVLEFERRARNFPDLSREVEVVLQLVDSLWLYYMIDVERRCVFWIDKVSMDESVLPPNFGLGRIEHLRHYLDFEFWQHIEYFPCHREVLPGILDELMGILVHSHIDACTSMTSHSPYTEDELQAMIGSVKNMQGLHRRGSASTYITTASARLMALYANERYYNFYGFPGARLSVDQTVRGFEEKNRSWLMNILAPILFFAPETHLDRLERLWIDDTIKGRLWKSFQNKLEKDWEGFVLYATVLLNANVAFLAIPFVESNNGPFWMSPSAVLSQISIIASLGSIIIGLLLVRQLRISGKESADDAIAFLSRRNHPRLGLETMAIQYSLPYALLMWGMVTFLASVMIMCFWDVAGYANLTKRLIYGCTWLFISLLILWTIITGWETTRHRKLLTSFTRLFQRWGGARNAGAEGEPEEDDESADGQSIRSIRAARAVTAVKGASGKSWRNRLKKMAEKPRRFTRSMTLDTVAYFNSRRKSTRQSTLTPVYSNNSIKNEKDGKRM